jgi:type I restriction enzyme S subunit
VAAVEALLARVQAARAPLAKVPALLKRFRQSVLAAEIVGELQSLGDVLIDLKYGTARKCDFEQKGVPVLRIPNIAAGFIDTSDLKYAELDPREFESLSLRRGDVLMIRSNGSVSLLGKTAVVSDSEEAYAYAAYLMRLRLAPRHADPGYLQFALTAPDARDQIELPARSTSGVHNINSEEVRQLRIPLPPLPEQHKIVRRVEALFALGDKIEARVAAATLRVEKITQAILAKAFRGELVPTEAELARAEGRDYEPASVLLEGIRAERAVAEKTPATGGKRLRSRKK